MSKTELEKEKEIEKLIKNLDIVKKLKFTKKEIADNKLMLQSYYINEKECEKNENCNVSHFEFYRDKNKKLQTKFALCPRTKIYKKINDIISFHNNRKSILFKNLIDFLLNETISIKIYKKYKDLYTKITEIIKEKQNFFCNFEFKNIEEKNKLILLLTRYIFLKDENKKIGYCDIRLLLNDLKLNFENNEYINNTLNKIKDVDILIIDNLGSEMVQKNLQDVYFFDILNNFLIEKKQIYFFSSKDLNCLNNYYKTTSKINFENLKNIIEIIKMLVKENILDDKNKKTQS